MTIQRPQEQELLARLAEPRAFIQVVAGPRQVGKSTLIAQVLAKLNAPYISVSADAVPVHNTAWLDQQWNQARATMATQSAPFIVLAVDEVQKLQNWSETVKKNWDSDTKNNIDVRVVLSGSSQLLLHEGLTESLAGRFEMIKMNHWGFVEMQNAFDITEEQYCYFGGYPGAARLIGQEARWRQYVKDSLIEATISKDILMLTRVDKPALLKQTFELACAYSTQELSFNKLIGQLQNAGNATTLSNYINILGNAQLVGQLQKYSGSVARTKSSTPKFVVYNNALHTVQQPLVYKQAIAQPALWGRWVESIVGAHLQDACFMYNMELYYWRDGNNEVDFVLVHNKKAIAIEVKSGGRHKHSGMDKANAQFNFYKTFLVGIEGFDWKQFIKMDLRILFE